MPRSGAFLSLRQLEGNVNHRNLVDRLAVSGGRLEADTRGGKPGLFVKPVTEPVDDTQNLDLTLSSKANLKRHVTLDVGFARLLGVLGQRLREHDQRGCNRLLNVRGRPAGRPRILAKPG